MIHGHTGTWWRRRAGALGAVVILGACHLNDSQSTPPAADVTRVLVTPADVNIHGGERVQFAAAGLTPAGDTLAIAVAWAATGGTIDATGLYLADLSSGDYSVTATMTGSVLAGSAQVHNDGAVLSQVILSPSAASLVTGASARFAAYGRLDSGDSVGVVVRYEATGGVIDTAGRYVAGPTPGAYRVIATEVGGTLADTAAITVTGGAAGGTVFVGAGDISDCGNDNDEATAQLLDGIAGTVFTLGDNVYSSGTADQFAQCYDPTWGRHKARTRPAPGNHDYKTSGASAYYAYFGNQAGPAGLGYYSFDLGDWHIVSLNSEISTSAGSPQEVWLRADLAASTRSCTLAYWHKPRFSSGTKHGSTSSTEPLWQALQDFHADIVMSGHEHNYERFAPQTAGGTADALNGIREFVVGTGGESHYDDQGTPLANSEVFNGTTYGVLKLTLGAGTYAWEFVPVAGSSFTDSGSGICH